MPILYNEIKIYDTGKRTDGLPVVDIIFTGKTSVLSKKYKDKTPVKVLDNTYFDNVTITKFDYYKSKMSSCISIECKLVFGDYTCLSNFPIDSKFVNDVMIQGGMESGGKLNIPVSFCWPSGGPISLIKFMTNDYLAAVNNTKKELFGKIKLSNMSIGSVYSSKTKSVVDTYLGKGLKYLSCVYKVRSHYDSSRRYGYNLEYSYIGLDKKECGMVQTDKHVFAGCSYYLPSKIEPEDINKQLLKNKCSLFSCNLSTYRFGSLDRITNYGNFPVLDDLTKRTKEWVENTISNRYDTKVYPCTFDVFNVRTSSSFVTIRSDISCSFKTLYDLKDYHRKALLTYRDKVKLPFITKHTNQPCVFEKLFVFLIWSLDEVIDIEQTESDLNLLKDLTEPNDIKYIDEVKEVVLEKLKEYK